MQLCSQNLLRSLKYGKTSWKALKISEKGFGVMRVLCEKTFDKKNHHALTDSCSKNCIEFARIGNAHEVQRRWRNCWQNMKKKKSFKKT